MTLLVDECCARDKCLLTTTSDVTIANTSVETSFRDGFLGLGYLPAWRIRPGTAVCWRMFGTISTGATNVESTFRFKLGNTVVATSTANLPINLSNAGWDGYFDCVIRSVGQNGFVFGAGRTIINIAAPIGDVRVRRISSGTAVAIDTRSDLLVDATYQWTTASASNSVTSNVFVIQTNT